MTDTKMITITSGFMIPANEYYAPILDNTNFLSDYLSRSNSSNNNAIVDYFKSKNIYSSTVVNDAFFKYNNDSSFENYMTLINIVFNILKSIDVFSFFKLQAVNPNLSNISMKFCLDLLKHMEINNTSGNGFNYNDYAVIPYNIRFNMENSFNPTNERDIKLITDCFKNKVLPINWENFISVLCKDKNVFITFYKYIFSDVY